MIELTTEQMAAAMGAEILARGSGGVPGRAEIDSREIAGGELFFGLTGGQSDGGEHARGALEAGAWGVVVTPERAAELAGGERLLDDTAVRAHASNADRTRHDIGGVVEIVRMARKLVADLGEPVGPHEDVAANKLNHTHPRP